MLVITTIYFTRLEPVRDPVTGKLVERNPSELEHADRKVVVVYQGTSHGATEGGH